MHLFGLQRERLSFSLGIGSGFSYVDSLAAAGLFGPDQNGAAYFKALGIVQSNTLTKINLTTAYQLSPKSILFAQFPLGAVEKPRAEGPKLPGIVSYAFALGEPGIGYSRELMIESSTKPKIEGYVYADSNLARFSSFGDGLWDLQAGFRMRKFVSRAHYAIAEADYTHRFGAGGVHPGGIVGAGFGVGSLIRSGVWKLETAVKSYSQGESTANGRTLLKQSNDLVFQASLVNASDGKRINLNVGQLESGFALKSNSVGFDLTMPIWQRR